MGVSEPGRTHLNVAIEKEDRDNDDKIEGCSTRHDYNDTGDPIDMLGSLSMISR